MNNSQSPLLTRREAAAYLHISPSTLANWATSRKYELPFVKVGARAMYFRRELDRFLEARTQRCRPPNPNTTPSELPIDQAQRKRP